MKKTRVLRKKIRVTTSITKFLMLRQQLLQVRREGLVEVDDARVRDAPPVRDGPPPQQVHAGHLDLLPVVRPRHVRPAAGADDAAAAFEALEGLRGGGGT